ncbi:MAG: MAP7 domain-containing protein [Bacteroidales bacterium]|jgi:hypothetical protein|nr:MAP7 domain-containing protein [Bacteroidales bacterium]
MRYLHYVRKLKKATLKKARLEVRRMESESRKKARAHRKNEARAYLEKKKHDRAEFRKQQQALEEEYRQDLERNRQKYHAEEAERKARIKKEKQFRRHRRKKLFRFYFKYCLKNILLSIKGLHPANIPLLIERIRDNRIHIKEFLIITTHSTLFFVAAYILVFAIMLFTSAISGVFFDYSSIVYYYEVLWIVKPEEWFGDSVKMIYSSGPIISSIIAVFATIIFSYIRTERGLGKLFIMWFFIHAYNAFFGSLLIGSLFGRGFGYAIIWSFISDTEKVIYSIISITALFLLGVFITRSFLISANSYYPKLKKRYQQFFIWAQVILPFILGNIFIGILMFPKMLWYDMTVALCLGIAILPVAVGYRFYPSLYFEEDQIRPRFLLRPIIFALAFLLIYRLVLEFGIKIG